MSGRVRWWWRIVLAAVAAAALCICAWWPNRWELRTWRTPLGVGVGVTRRYLVFWSAPKDPSQFTDEDYDWWTWFYWGVEFLSHHGELDAGPVGVRSHWLYGTRFVIVARRPIVVCSFALLLPTLTAGVASLRRRRWRVSNRCVSCGYPLCGLPARRCPECGTPF